MPWNPSPEVAVARDAASRLGATQAVVFYVLPNGKYGYASYGKTKPLCAGAKRWADFLYDNLEGFFETESLIVKPLHAGGLFE